MPVPPVPPGSCDCKRCRSSPAPSVRTRRWHAERAERHNARAPAVRAEFDAHEVDRFSCYKAKIAKSAAKLPKTVEVTIADQLTNPAVRFAVKKVLRLCVPTAKDGDAVKHADHLVCYEVAPTKGRCAGGAPLNAGAGCKKEEECGGTKGTTTFCAKQAKFAKVVGVLTTDDFRISTLDLAKNAEVCLPSRRVP
jgi:hypothetical protein